MDISKVLASASPTAFTAVLGLTLCLVPAMASAGHTPDPAGVAIAGDLQSELGCSGDWQPECPATELAYHGDDDLWQATYNVPAGSWSYKAALNDSWAENYGAGATADGPNIDLSIGSATNVRFYYDHETHWITDNINSTIATVAGSFQSELGCPGDWQPWCLRSWMQDPDGDGIYTFTSSAIPAGSYEFKVALDESWDMSWPLANVPFTSGLDDLVTITYDATTNDVVVTVTPSGVQSVTIAGSLQDELGCSGDWQPDCAATHLAYDAEDDVWQGTFSLPAGAWEYKAAIDDSWDENYGANGVADGASLPLGLAGPMDVKFYYDPTSHWVTDDVNSIIATVAGSLQSELGCSGDWQPWCLRSWMQDLDGDGIYVFATAAIPAGSYEFKVAIDEDWVESWPASNVPFSVATDDVVTFSFDSATHAVAVVVGTNPTNMRPTADAGDDQFIVVYSTAVLDGSASSDPESDLIAYDWTMTSAPAGSSAVLYAASTVQPYFTPDLAGVYEVELTVSDFIGAGSSDTVVITATLAQTYAETRIVLAVELLSSLPLEAVTTRGNRVALNNFLAQAVAALQAGNVEKAVDKLTKAMMRTDGCVLRGSPDVKGKGRDWVTDCDVQAELHALLNEALAALS